MGDPQCTYLVSLIEEWYKDDLDKLAFIQEHWRGPTGLRPRWTTNLVNRPHIFITILLDRSLTAKENFDAVAALPVRFGWLIGSMAVLEFTPHPHVHILTERDQIPRFHKGNIIKTLSRALKVKPEKVDIKLGHLRKDYQHRASYIVGDKVDAAKRARCEADTLIRTSWGIPQYFILGSEHNAVQELQAEATDCGLPQAVPAEAEETDEAVREEHPERVMGTDQAPHKDV